MSVEELAQKAKEAAHIIKETGGIIVVATHLDADGICSGAIVAKTLSAIHKRFVVVYDDTLTLKMLDQVLAMNPALVWMTDIGSGQEYLSMIEKTLLKAGIKVLITDHHTPGELENPGLVNLNCNFFGVNGNEEAAGSTVTYLVARELVENHVELIPLVIVGAVGDREAEGVGLKGLNRDIMKEGVKNNVVQVDRGLKIYGRSTYSLPYALAYSAPFDIPSFSGDMEKVLNFLGEIKLRVVHPDGSWRSFVELSKEEKEYLQEQLVILLIKNGLTPEQINACFGEFYFFPEQDKKSNLYFSDEFATLLNGCSRGCARTDIAIGVALGNKELYETAKELLEEYRQILKEVFKFVHEHPEIITRTEHIVSIQLPEHITHRITGNIASILLNSDITKNKLVAVVGTNKEAGTYKLSLRVPPSYNIHAAQLLGEVCKGIEGASSGGHPSAAAFNAPSTVDMEKIIQQINDVIESVLQKS